MALGAEETEGTPNDKQDVKEEGIEVSAARKSVPFYMLVAFFFLITSISSFSMHIPKHLENLGYDVGFAGSIMSVYMIGILIGSLVLGVLVDVLKPALTAVLTLGLVIVAIASLIYVTGSTLVMSLAVGVFGLISASIGTVAPALVTSLFGEAGL